ncbi:hypothetical protein MED01_007045 [Micromonospora sp. MED01]|uniref:hypothetical protein n=1 Tax=Micromonospora alfalfae TaxID=2911212 RepID=UPI001EE79D6E|nr:hypothetical protein [Micromonospora alfalfae]MCG5462167.1 hypothetical protein [Micromonospora alfalfae]
MDKLILPRPDICPDWCDEHYTGQCGTRNHVGEANRYVLGQAQSGAPLSVAVWPEVRISASGHVSAVGILDIASEVHDARGQMAEVELTRDHLRDLAAHLLDVAAQLDAVLQG